MNFSSHRSLYITAAMAVSAGVFVASTINTAIQLRKDIRRQKKETQARKHQIIDLETIRAALKNSKTAEDFAPYMKMVQINALADPYWAEIEATLMKAYPPEDQY